MGSLRESEPSSEGGPRGRAYATSNLRAWMAAPINVGRFANMLQRGGQSRWRGIPHNGLVWRLWANI